MRIARLILAAVGLWIFGAAPSCAQFVSGQGLSSGSSPTFTGLTLSSMTQGSVLFAGSGGLVSQDPSNFFWDDTNNRFGINTNSSLSNAFTVAGNVAVGNAQAGLPQIKIQNMGWTNIGYIGKTFAGNFTQIGENLSLASTTTGNLAETASGGYALNIGVGSAAFYFAAAGANPVTLTNTLFMDGSNRVGIGTIIPQARLAVGGTAATAYTSNLDTDASNYERAYMGDWGVTANVATYGTGKAGTGSTRNVQFVVGGTRQLDFGITNASSWSFQSSINTAGNVYSSGAVAGLLFQARDLTQTWTWYANSNVARLFNGSADILTVSLAGLITTASPVLIASSVALTNGAAAQAGTLLNAPTAGNPTKWVPINDNGTTRYIPAW